MKTKAFIIILIALFTLSGKAQSWVYVTSDVDQSNIYINSKLVYLANTIEVWVKTTEISILYDKDGVQANVPGRSTVCLLEIDYLHQKYRIRTVVILDSNNKISDMLDLKGPQSGWYSIVPDSIYEKVLKAVSELFS